MQERRRRASGASHEQATSASRLASADSCESQPPTWDNRSPQDTARARYASHAIRHGLREDKHRIARAVHATSTIDATRAQHLTRTGNTPLRDLHPTPRAHELPASFAHLADSKIASHPVATRITVRAQRHAHDSERDEPSSSGRGDAGERLTQTVPLRKTTPSSVFTPPLPQRSAQPVIAS